MAQIPETVKLLADLPEADFICGVYAVVYKYGAIGEWTACDMPAAKEK